MTTTDRIEHQRAAVRVGPNGSGSAPALWERLMIYRSQMAPQVASREAGQLIIAASEEIARLMMVESSAIRDGDTIARYRQRVEDQQTEIIRLRSLLPNDRDQGRAGNA